MCNLIDMAQNNQQLHLQLEATWCLANIASGTTEEMNTLLNKNIIPIFIELCKSSYSQIAEQAIWGLGNISGDSFESAMIVLRSDAVNVLLDVLDRTNNGKIQEQIIWVFSNLCIQLVRSKSKHSSIRRMLIRLADFFVDAKAT